MNYRHIRGPELDPATGLVSGEIELDGGLPTEEPEDELDQLDDEELER